MKIKALRELYGVGDYGLVRAGAELDVTKSTAAELVATGLAEVIGDEEDEEEGVVMETIERKAQPAPLNKAQPVPGNKAAPAPTTK